MIKIRICSTLILKCCFVLILLKSQVSFGQIISPHWIIDNNHFLVNDSLELVNVFTPSPSRICGNQTSSIVDKNGKLLLYTDGKNLYDDTYSTTPNGTQLFGRIFRANSLVVAPDYHYEEEHYIFYLPEPTMHSGLFYSTVDMNLNNGRGDIPQEGKNINVLSDIEFSYIDILLDNCQEYWIVAKEQNAQNLYLIKITRDGSVDFKKITLSFVGIEDLTVFGGISIFHKKNMIIIDNGKGVKDLITLDEEMELSDEILLTPHNDLDFSIAGAFSFSGHYYYCLENQSFAIDGQPDTLRIVRYGPLDVSPNGNILSSNLFSYVSSNISPITLGPNNKMYFANVINVNTLEDKLFIGMIDQIDDADPVIEETKTPFIIGEGVSCSSSILPRNTIYRRHYNSSLDYESNQDCFIINLSSYVDIEGDLSPHHLWSTGDTTEEIVVTSAGEYSLMITDQYGCTITDTITISEDPDCPPDIADCHTYLPNAISTISTRDNEEFYPQSSCPLFDYQMSIYDRWGGRVYHSSDPTQRWDGSSTDQAVIPGVFSYITRYRYSPDSDIIRHSGTVTVIR